MPELPANGLLRRGRCHVLGDDVSLDNDIIPARFSRERVTDANVLVPQLFANLDPELAAKIRHGDIILAGRNFACGKPRLQGFIAMGALHLSVLCTSMPYKMLRRAVARGIPVITGVSDIAAIAGDGDELEIDFATGAILNLANDRSVTAPAMPALLRDIVAAGGTEAMLKQWLVEHPGQAAGPA